VSRLAVVSYPRLTDADSHWIESIRTRHDPQASFIRAHFTLVFPVEVSPESVMSHVAVAASAASRIRFVLRSARAVRDVSEGSGGHVFLLPREGASEIATLHRALYGGALRPHLQSDRPFAPHVTVAAHPDFGRCEALALELDGSSPEIAGTIEDIEILEITSPGVRCLRRLPLPL